MRKSIFILLFIVYSVVATSQRYPSAVHRRALPADSSQDNPGAGGTSGTGNTSGGTGNGGSGGTGSGGGTGNGGAGGGSDPPGTGNNPPPNSDTGAPTQSTPTSPPPTSSSTPTSTSTSAASNTENTQKTSPTDTPGSSTTLPPTSPPAPTDQSNPPPTSTPSMTNTNSPDPTTGPSGEQTAPSSPASSSNSKQTSPASGATSNNNNDSSVPTGTIIGLSVAGGVAVFAFIAFLIWKLTRKRFHDLDIDEAIKWPEVGREASSNVGYATGLGGDALSREISPSRSAPSRDFLPETSDPYAVPPLPHYNPSLPYRDDPNNSTGYYDPYRGPAPTALYEGPIDGHESIPLGTLPNNARTRSPAPGVALDFAGRGSPAPGAIAYQAQTGQSAYGQSGTAPYRSY